MSTPTKPLAFVSYSWADNEDGFVEQFASQLEKELHVQLGEPASIFLDKSGLRPGQPWEAGLRKALDQSAFLIPIVTPSYLRSQNARSELGAFLHRDPQAGSIFPIHYIDALKGKDSDPLAHALSSVQWVDWRKLRFEPWDSPLVRRTIQQLAQSIRTAIETRTIASAPLAVETLAVERLQLENFRCFDDLDLHFAPNHPFREPSTLPGNWTCIAGINGVGKSSILQAVSIALLGELAKELGGGLMARMRRAGMSPSERTSINLSVRRGEKTLAYSVQIDEKGGLRTNFPPPVETSVALAYGATRNLGEEADSPFKSLSPQVQSMIGMFRPLAQLASAEVLLSERRRSPHLLPLFSSLVRDIFENNLTVETDAPSKALRFGVAGKDRIEANDLPDGFRSSAAWLADLCATWCERQPEVASTGNPAEIEAIVMIDEIDLHLHPALQRELVPRLRKALPRVQWIVTTHSPLVLANFDSNEIIALDREVEGKVRRLDRQILNFSSDQIYDWLMGTRPTGAAMDQLLQQSDRNPESTQQLQQVAELMRTTPESSPEDASRQVSEFRDILKSLKR